jgi:hypothetical protein
MTRTLDSRKTDGLKVELLWEPKGDEIWLHVMDTKATPRTQFLKRVPSHEALKAFHHPFLYAPRV